MLSKQICVQYFADVFENKISAKFTPDGVLWKQFAAAIWESAEEQEVLSQLFALVDQFSFLMIGNPRDLSYLFAEYFVEVVAAGSHVNCFRGVVAKILELSESNFSNDTFTFSAHKFDFIHNVCKEIFFSSTKHTLCKGLKECKSTSKESTKLLKTSNKSMVDLL